jgi:hypothetical protein
MTKPKTVNIVRTVPFVEGPTETVTYEVLCQGWRGYSPRS